jgi:uncharacterized membrane protein SpoIIM required for sporulation
MNKFAHYTAVILIATGCLWLLWEVVALSEAGDGATFSAVLRQANYNSGGIIALVLAALYCHVFLSAYLPKGWF